MSYEFEERSARDISAYMRRLLIERNHIRAALENPGGSVILMGVAATVEQTTSFSSVVGNDYHLDLIELEGVISRLPADQRRALMAWADGLTSKQAADYYNVRPSAIRMRRKRALEAVAQEMVGAPEGAES